MGSSIDLLEGLSALREPEPDARAAVDDGELLAYRRGDLSEADALRVETALVESAAARRLLVELARVEESESAPSPSEGQGTLSALTGLRKRPPPLNGRPLSSQPTQGTLSALTGLRKRPTPLKGLKWRAALAAGALAAAALMVLLIPSTPRSSSLPSYKLEGPLGFVRAERGSASRAQYIYDPSSVLEVILRPDRRHDQAVSVHLFAGAQEGKLHRIPKPSVESREGTLRLRMDADALFREPGAKTVWIGLISSDAGGGSSSMRPPVGGPPRSSGSERWWVLHLQYAPTPR